MYEIKGFINQQTTKFDKKKSPYHLFDKGIELNV